MDTGGSGYKALAVGCDGLMIPDKIRFQARAGHRALMVILILLSVSTGQAMERLAIYDPMSDDESGRLLWGVGRMNGRPNDEHADLEAGEFAFREANDSVMAVRELGDFPQVLSPGQSLVIQLGALPRENLVLRLALVTRADEDGALRPDPARSRLRITFNGRAIWRRGFIDGHALIATFVPASFVENDRNLLTIENDGTQPAAFDALRLERYAPGNAITAALAGAQRLPGSLAADIPQAVLRLELPADPANIGADEKWPRVTAPHNLHEALQAQRTMMVGSQDWIPWDDEIARALQRGMLPIVAVQSGTESAHAWHAAAARYGRIIHAWAVETSTQAEHIRHQVDGARVYGIGTTWRPVRLATADSPDFDALFISRYTEAFGGRIDRQAGRLRAAAWRAEHVLPPLGAWLRPPPSLQDIRMQRRNGARAVETIMQWLMAGGDLMIMEGAEIGSDFFPGQDGHPSPAWDTARLIFAMGDGTPRRSVCAVVPAAGDHGLSDTQWVVSENGAELVTALLLAGYDDLGQSVRLHLPVPWSGRTEGLVEGVRYANWRDTNPENVPARELQLTATAIPTSADEAAPAPPGFGHVTLGLSLDGLVRVRLWPAGRPPPSRTARLQGIPASIATTPEILRGVFRLHSTPPPPIYRYETLRQPDWSAGALGGGHTATVRPATRGTVPARLVGDSFRETGVSGIPNVVPRDAQSLFITFQPGVVAHGFRCFQSDQPVRQGAWGMMVYAKARVSTPPGIQTSSTPAHLWLGHPARRERLDLALDRWQLITAPFDGFLRHGESAAFFHLWPDAAEKRSLEIELNGFMAMFTVSEDGRKLAAVRMATRWEDNRRRLLWLIEGPPGQPAAPWIRLEQPARVLTYAVAAPRGMRGVRLVYRDAAQWLEAWIPSLPAAGEGMSAADTRALFTGIAPDPNMQRVLLELELER